MFTGAVDGLSTVLRVLVATAVGCVAGVAATGTTGAFLLVLPAIAVPLVWPCVSLAGMLTAGLYKADPRVTVPGGFDLTLLFALSLVLVLLVEVLKSRNVLRRLWQERVFLASWAIFLMILSLGLTRTPSPEYGYAKALHFVVIGGLAVLVPLIWENRQTELFYRVLFGLSLAMALDALSRMGEGRYHLTAFSSNYLGLARQSGYGLLIGTLYLLPKQRTSMGRALVMILNVPLAFALLAAGGRGPVVSCLIALSYLFPYDAVLSRVATGQLRIRRLAGALLVLVLIGVLTVLIVVSPRGLFDVLRSRFSLALGPDVGSSTLTRLDYWKLASSLFIQNPVMGVGTGGFSRWAVGSDAHEYPHNLFLEIASELGIVGLASFLMVIVSALYAFRYVASTGDEQSKESVRLVSVLALYALVNACVSGDLNDNRMLFALLAILKRTGTDTLHEAGARSRRVNPISGPQGESVTRREFQAKRGPRAS
ncbi:MAG: O-antigen ligase family protein [Firmicutes bacterium]|nr:O-antigen ligase family protein [Bacillota bacterium]